MEESEALAAVDMVVPLKASHDWPSGAIAARLTVTTLLQMRLKVSPSLT